MATITVLVGISGAFACTNLATLLPSTDTARPGERVTILGASFRVSRVADQPTPPVQLRWETVDGPVLATAVPDHIGAISVTIDVPEAPAGHAIIVATQQREVVGADSQVHLVHEVGTPARTSIRILAPGEPRTTRSGHSLAASASDNGPDTSILVLTVVAAALALSLFGGGFLAFLHQHRTLGAQPQRWPPVPRSWG